MQSYIVFDIETVALDWNSLSASQQEYLVRNAKDEDEVKKKKDEMALYPLTSQVVCLGLQFVKLDDENNEIEIKKHAYAVDNSYSFDSKDEITLSTGDNCSIVSETRLISYFWELIDKYKNTTLITFNGRNFDIPFLMLRSAILKIRPSKNLMSGTKFNYFSSSNHIDLIDELTFYNPSSYGATKRFNFDFYTRAFGITSPKSEGVDGSKVAELFKEGKITEIAEYCLRDVTATWELFKIWKKYLFF